jgi:hypothetical protein
VPFVYPFAFENCHIFLKGHAKTLSNMSLRAKAVSTAKIENIFPTNKHSAGVLRAKVRIIFRVYPLWTQWALFRVDYPTLWVGRAAAPGCGGSHFVSRHRWLRPAFEPFNFDLIFVSLTPS